MKKQKSSALKKDTLNHHVQAQNNHFNENIEVANEFFNDNYVRPVDVENVFVEELTENIVEANKKSE